MYYTKESLISNITKKTLYKHILSYIQFTILQSSPKNNLVSLLNKRIKNIEAAFNMA